MHVKKTTKTGRGVQTRGRIALSVVLVLLFAVVVGLVIWLRGLWQGIFTVCVAVVVFLMQRKK